MNDQQIEEAFKTGVLVVSIMREKNEPKGVRKVDIRGNFIIAPPTISIPDEGTLIRTLLPYSTPPDSVTVILNDETAVTVENLEWIENPGTGTMLYRLCMCTCMPGKTYTCAAPDKMTYEQCCDRCCKMRLEGPQPEPMPYDRVSGPRLAEVEASLAQVGLKRASGPKKKYPIDLNLIEVEQNPQQYISCLRRDANGNCTWWRVCGVEKTWLFTLCYDIILTPYGWGVASHWERY
jgi:hypothetical protein